MKEISFAGVALCAMTMFAPTLAQAAGIDGTGSMPTCPAKGSIKLKPGLVAAGIEPVAIKLSAQSSGACTGGTGDGANIVGVKAKAAGTAAANECSSFAGTSSTDLALTFKWKVAKDTPKLNPSTATFSLQPGAVAPDFGQTFNLTGTITAGSFTGREITARISSDDTAAVLIGECGVKGLKKIGFGMEEGTTDSCLNGPNLHAAITKQITTIDGSDVPHLEVELLTVTASPFELGAPVFTTSRSDIELESTDSSCVLSNGNWRCHHTAHYKSTGACQWTGDYSLALSYTCDPTNTCDLCSGGATIPFTLNSEYFCD